MVSFEIFVKAMPPSLLELKVLPSFCFAFKIPDDVAASNIDPTYKKDKKGGGGQKSPILRRHSLWTGPLSIYRLPPLSSLCFMNYREIMNWCKVACLKLQNFMKQGSQCSVKCEQSHYVHLKSKTG